MQYITPSAPTISMMLYLVCWGNDGSDKYASGRSSPPDSSCTASGAMLALIAPSTKARAARARATAEHSAIFAHQAVAALCLFLPLEMICFLRGLRDHQGRHLRPIGAIELF